MIKIRYLLFGGRRNVLDCDLVDLQRGVGADTVEEPRGAAGGSDAARTAPSASRSRQTVWIRHRPSTPRSRSVRISPSGTGPEISS
jgi:hypothetical protein